MPDGQAAALLIGLGAVGVLVALRASGRFPVHSGLLLGTAGGIVFGLMAGAIKSTTSAWSVGELFTSWPLYVMVAVGLSGFLLNQHIYNRTRLPESLPMLNLVNPLVALTFGFVVFRRAPARFAVVTGAGVPRAHRRSGGHLRAGRTRVDEPDVDGADPARGRIGPGAP